MNKNYTFRHQKTDLPNGYADEDFFISNGELPDSGTLLKLQMFIDSRWYNFCSSREPSSTTAFICIIIDGGQIRNGIMLQPGDVIFERSRGGYLESFSIPECTLHRKVIIITLNPVFELLARTLFSENTTVFRKVSNRIKELFEKIHTAVSEDADKKYVSMLLFELIQELNGCRDHDKLPENMNKILKFIKGKGFQNISRENICKNCGISNRQLNNLFRKYMNISPAQYIIARKIEFAKELLSGKKLPVNEIAAMCGFNSTEFFIRVFKKHTGMTPGKWN